jgi:uncharacterized protein (UPF0261 family)
MRVDVGTRNPMTQVDISATKVAGFHPGGASAVLDGDDRGQAVASMGAAFERFLTSRDDIGAIIGIGGGGGTSIITRGMRALPLGLPKIMVSTLASGDVGPYVDVSDIIMAPSITDFAGLNRVSRVVLSNAAQAIAGMTKNPAVVAEGKPSLGLTMFGVTTPCVMAISEQLRSNYDCLVFHATGVGGQSMEKLAESGLLEGVIDVSTTEVADEIGGGVLSAGAARLDVFARHALPYVGSCGALDMVNFGAWDTVPERFKGRRLYKHNPGVTLMRTTADESRAIGEFIARKLNAMRGPVRFLIPEGGVSAIDRPGAPFHDPEADRVLFDAIAQGFRVGPERRLVRLPHHVNDQAFADALVAAWLEIAPAAAHARSA